ncbi:MAG: TRAP transporter large permease subunit [Pseudomonadota bacterium]
MTELALILQDHFAEFLGAYMFLVLVALMFSGIPVAYALGGTAVMFGMLGVMLDLLPPAGQFLPLNRIWGGGGIDGTGIVHNYALVVIPCFLFMGTMLEKSRVAEELLHILQVMLRRLPGVLALSVALMGTIMAATTGIAGASVVMMTLMALPTMLGRGYSPSLATGTIAASATLGILIPPSMILVILAFMLALPAGSMFLGAVLPGLTLSGLYLLYIFAAASIRPSIAPPLPKEDVQLDPQGLAGLVRTVVVLGAIVTAMILGPGWSADVNWNFIGFFAIFLASMILGRMEGNTLLGGILRGFVPPVFLIGMVIGSIFAGWATITEAAGVGAFGALMLAVVKGTSTRKVITDTVHRTALSNAMYFFIFAGAIAYSTIFRLANGEELIRGFIEWLDFGPWGFLFLLMGVIFVMGFFFDFLEITLIIMPVFSPVVRGLAPEFAPHLGVDVPENAVQLKILQDQVMYWFAILVATNLQTSFLTPPFGFSLFYMKGVAPASIKMQDIYRGVAPFVVLQLIGLGLVLAFPALALWLPGMVIGW